MSTTTRRVSLSVPGGDARKLDKAASIEIDEIVLDLEDSVPAAAKDRARDMVAAATSTLAADSIAVRVNAIGTPWCPSDIIMCAQNAKVTSVVVPKVESADDLAFVDRLLTGAQAATGRTDPIRIQALVETAGGLLAATAIAQACDRLDSLIIGYADLAATLGRSPSASWQSIQDQVLLAARAAGIQAIDGPHLSTTDDEAFRAAVQAVRDLGFDGKWIIHPRQAATVVSIFTPSADQVHHARQVLATLAAAEQQGLGAAELDGHMIDEALAVAARRVLDRADHP